MARSTILKRLVAAGFITAAFFVLALSQRGSRVVARHFGYPVPTSVKNVRYSSSEWLGLMPEPSYYLRFTASSNDIALLLQRLGAKAAGPTSPASTFAPTILHANPGKPHWWAFDSAEAKVQTYGREQGRPCVIEWLWWDQSNDTLFYHLFCP